METYHWSEFGVAPPATVQVVTHLQWHYHNAFFVAQIANTTVCCAVPCAAAAGVAYHHAGLTHQERAIVEQGFSSGALLVLTATSTLAAGVNLPAQRVILRSLWQGVEEVSRAQYLQMVGRAGRAGEPQPFHWAPDRCSNMECVQ